MWRNVSVTPWEADTGEVSLFQTTFEPQHCFNYLVIRMNKRTSLVVQWESACQCKEHGFYSWSGKISHDAEQLRLCATTTKPHALGTLLCDERGHRNENAPRLESSPRSSQLEKSPRGNEDPAQPIEKTHSRRRQQSEEVASSKVRHGILRQDPSMRRWEADGHTDTYLVSTAPRRWVRDLHFGPAVLPDVVDVEFVI